jgi:formylglycine-generating enzyme required for sulfatase activity
MVNQDETASVGSLLPSAAGVLDLSGNVFEWQQDRWTDMLAAGVDVQGPALGTNRALRGGAWDGSRLFAQPSSSLGIDPDYRGGDLGVRLLRTAP